MPTKLYLAPAAAFLLPSGTYPADATNYAAQAPTTALTHRVNSRLTPYRWGTLVTATLATAASVAAQVSVYGRFISTPFTNDTALHTGTGYTLKYYGADMETNLSANHWVGRLQIYVWRPSTGAKVGDILTNAAQLGAAAIEPSAASSIRTSGYAATTITSVGDINALAGDVIVVEPYAAFTQGAATAYSTSFYYGGTTDPSTTENTVVTSPASYIEFSQTFALDDSSAVMVATIFNRGDMYYADPNIYLESALSSVATSSGVLTNIWASRCEASATINASLTTDIKLAASLQSISNWYSSLPQTHQLSCALHAEATLAGNLPSTTPVAGLVFVYSGEQSSYQPQLSLGGKISTSVYRDQIATFSSPITGVSIIMASGLPDTGSVFTYNQVASTVSATIRGITYTLDVPIQEYVCLGRNESGYIMVSVTAVLLPATSTSVNIAATPIANSLFDDPDTYSLLHGRTEYRCLYLMNKRSTPVYDVSLQVSGILEETLSLGTEYATYMTLRDDYAAISHRISASAGAASGRISAYSLRRGGVTSMPKNSTGSPFRYLSDHPSQVTDGNTLDLPLTIDDILDTTNKLSRVSFSSVITWGSIYPNRGVTFWVKKVQGISPTIPTYEKLRFQLTANV